MEQCTSIKVEGPASIKLEEFIIPDILDTEPVITENKCSNYVAVTADSPYDPLVDVKQEPALDIDETGCTEWQPATAATKGEIATCSTSHAKSLALEHKKDSVYKCRTCGKECTTKGQLTLHKNTHTQFSCAVCSKAFSSFQSLNVHMSNHEQKKRKNEESEDFNCEISNETLCRERKTSHKKRKPKKRKPQKRKRSQQCTICGKVYYQPGLLEIHMVHHTIKRQFICDQCDLSHTTVDALRIHIKNHHPEWPQKCVICEMSFTLRSELESHMWGHDAEQLFKCNICDLTYATAENLAIHDRTHDLKHSFKCYTCGEEFLLRRLFINHIFSHSPRYPFSCEICTCSFKTDDLLFDHERSHRLLEGEPLECGICGKLYATERHLQAHKSFHTKEQTLTCTCGIEFSFREGLTEHQMNNCKDRPHKCAVCGKAFLYNRTLRAHLDQHKNDTQEPNMTMINHIKVEPDDRE